MSPNPSYISIATTAKRLNKSIRTIWRWTNQKKAEGFPQPIKLSAGTKENKHSRVIIFQKTSPA